MPLSLAIPGGKKLVHTVGCDILGNPSNGALEGVYNGRRLHYPTFLRIPGNKYKQFFEFDLNYYNAIITSFDL